MSEPNERLQLARASIFKNGETPTDVARQFNWVIPTYLGHENGSRGISKKAARRYAKAFKVSSDWLLFNQGAMRADATVPLGGYIGTGGAIMPVDDYPKGRGMAEAPAPPEMGPDTIAYEVRGDSQWPAFSDGDYVYADQPFTSPEEAIGKLCIVMTGTGERMLKMVKRGTRKGLYQLVSINAPPLDDVRIELAAVVTWIKKRR